MNFKKWMKEWGVPFAIVIVASLLIRTYGFAHIQVFNVSMQNTLYEGHRLIEDKISYRFTSPERGDIVILNGPEYPERLIKRVIGLPGEEINIMDGYVYVNGEQLEEPYIKGVTTAHSIALPFKVPDDTVFVMGDNREHSVDSRDLGAIPFSSVEGKAAVRFWPLSKLGTVD